MAESYYRLMNAEEYQPALDVIDLVGQLKRLLISQRQADRLICRYLADLADGMAKCTILLLAYGDVHAFARARLGLSSRAIRERIRVGRALRELPLLDAALMSGVLTYSRIREVTRVATPETERVWLEVAKRLSMRALEQRVAIASGQPPSRPRGCGPQADIELTNPLLNLPGEVLALLNHAMGMARARAEDELTDAEALTAVARAAIAHLARSPIAVARSTKVARASEVADAWHATPTHSGSADDAASEAEATAGTEVLTEDPQREDPEAEELQEDDPQEADFVEEVTLGADPLGADFAKDDAEATHSGSRHDRLRHGGSGHDGSGHDGSGHDGSGHGGSGHDGSGHGGSTQSGSRKGRSDWRSGTSTESDGLRSTRGESAKRSSLEHGPLSTDEELLLELVRSGGYWNAATLQHTTGMPTPRLQTALLNLELRHLIALGPLGELEACAENFSHAG